MLYRKYRPKRFADVVGQSIVGEVLKKSISTRRVAHAYLFSGPRGVGKTTLARLIAKSVNCLNRDKIDRKVLKSNIKDENCGEPCNKCEICLGLDAELLSDVVEIDAASNRGIDEIRELRDKVKFPPMRCRYKVYIIDEAHMLTREAFNALLKTLEEPPAHAIFILCTTEPQKIPDTIISRCQWYELRLGTTAEIVSKLSKIVKNEGIKVQHEVLELVASLGQGSFRDAESLFSMITEAVNGDEEITIEKVRSILKLPSQMLIRKVVDFVEQGDMRAVLKKLSLMKKRGFDGEKVIDFIISEVRKRVIDALDNPQILDKRSKMLKLFIESKKGSYLLPDPYASIELAIVEIISSSSGYQDKRVEKRDNIKNIKKDCDGEDDTLETSNQNGINSEDTFQIVVKKWKDVTKEAARYNNHLFLILESAEIKNVKDKQIILFVTNGFSKRVLESPKVVEILRKITKKIFGECYKIRCAVVDGSKKVKDLTKKELELLLNGEVTG